MSYKSEAVEAIFRLQPRDGQFSIINLILLTVTDAGLTPKIADEEKAARLGGAVFNGVLERQEALQKRGGLSTFDVVSLSNRRLRWRTGSVDGRMLRRKLAIRSCVARWLDGLDDRPYEFASALGMLSLGAATVHVTPPGNEFGIDFLAIVPAYTRSPVFVSGARGIRIVGQSKKYSTPVSREKLQSFNDCLTSIRNNRAELFSVVPPWFRGSYAPIISCFVSHSGFQSGSREIGRQAGHILLDTLELAEIIARIKEYSLQADEDEINRVLWSRIAPFEKRSAAHRSQ